MSKIFPIVVVLSLVVPASAHRVDEYLQATIVSVERDRVQFSMRLVPGIAVSSGIIATIDTNHDGIISETERQTYVQRILADLTLSIDGNPLQPQLTSAVFPTMEEPISNTGAWRADECGWCLLRPGGCREWSGHFGGPVPRGQQSRHLEARAHPCRSSVVVRSAPLARSPAAAANPAKSMATYGNPIESGCTGCLYRIRKPSRVRPGTRGLRSAGWCHRDRTRYPQAP